MAHAASPPNEFIAAAKKKIYLLFCSSVETDAMNILTLQPQPALAKYIDFYYFIREERHDFRSAHYSFPHTCNVVSIYHKANGKRSDKVVEVFEDPQREFMTLLQAKRPMPLRVEMRGKTDRISIFFKPLGLNAFVSSPLSVLMEGFELAEWDNKPLYQQSLKQVFNENTLEKRIEILENFLLGIIAPGEFSFLEKPLALLTDLENNYQIEDICTQSGFSLRSFNRKFKDAIGVSPVVYRQIARFRNSLENKLYHQQFKRLTDIGYSSHFYDQSYFNKIYRKMSGENPGAFFGQVRKLGNDKLIFKLIQS
ncbi:helix-turn-helix domain-containing protein [Pedobacter aquatilis]|uniref:helix-turn-helix domain-containing protein n=1 Tax=Pedobacter aquatilis TaxID=351343 RepID=UPI0029309428|nr:helix-turn-helix domain-containing protein [Pedobacter aquatilis]